uniref:BUB1 N-terminal domain-containing protein n=1 Tax=Tetranychus urticae TaxID=32264 RepID=T1L1W6_TETUR
MTACYSESLFQFLTFSGLLSIEFGRLSVASTFLALSSSTRANGIISFGFVAYYNIQYWDDTRFLAVVLNKKIFSKLAKFYVEWAWDLELAGNFKEADNVLHKGMMLEAEPSEDLTTSQIQLQVHLVKKIAAKDLDDSEASADQTQQRKALVGLRPTVKKGITKAPVDRVSSIKTDFQSLKASVESAKTRPAIDIHVDNNSCTEPTPSCSSTVITHLFLQKISAIYNTTNAKTIVTIGSIVCNHCKSFVVPHDKENLLNPSKWTGIKLKSKPTVVRQCEFVIYEEEDENSEVQADTNVAADVLKMRKKQVDAPSLLTLESLEPNQKFYCDLNSIYIGASEYSFEEIRYHKWLNNIKGIEKV